MMTNKQKTITLDFNYGTWAVSGREIKNTKSVKVMQKYIKDDIIKTLNWGISKGDNGIEVYIPWIGTASIQKTNVEFDEGCVWECNSLYGGEHEVACTGIIHVVVELH